MNKMLSIVIVIALVAIGAAFYGGLRYGESRTVNAAGGANYFAERANRSANASGPSRGMRGGGGFAAGEIIALDAKSITLKLQDGGSKIVLLAPSTAVMRSVTGSASDLSAGENVTIAGTANQDGSITAQSVQVRPPLSNPSVSK